MDTTKQQRQSRQQKLVKETQVTREGLFVAGAVAGRTKKMVGTDRQKELVTYRVQTPEATFFVKDWDANEEYLQLGEFVELPVRVSTYTSNGSTRIDYTLFRPREQHF